MHDVFPVQLCLAKARGLHAWRFPQDSWEAAGIVFLGRFCRLGTNGSLDSHNVGCVPLHPFPHTCTWSVATGLLSCGVFVLSLSRDPVLLSRGASIWQKI